MVRPRESPVQGQISKPLEAPPATTETPKPGKAPAGSQRALGHQLALGDRARPSRTGPWEAAVTGVAFLCPGRAAWVCVCVTGEDTGPSRKA